MSVRNDNSSISHSHRIDLWICCIDSCERVRVPLPFWHKLRMARHRDSSWFSFLCEGTIERSVAPVPASMLEVYPEVVGSEAVIPLRDIGREVCPRLFESKNCRDSHNCTYLHWFQGCCDQGGRCWNQHGVTFDAALRQALRAQDQLRGDEPPYNYSAEDGGVIRQVNREQARAWIQKSMAHFRHTPIRKWHFGTNFTRYYDYEAWNRSPEAEQVRAELSARANEPYRGRSPRHTSPRRYSSRVPASWSDGASTPRRSGLFPPKKSSFPSAFERLHGPSSSASTTTTRTRTRRPRALERVADPPSAPAMVRIGPRLRLCLRPIHRSWLHASRLRPSAGWHHRRRRRAPQNYNNITIDDAGSTSTSEVTRSLARVGRGTCNGQASPHYSDTGDPYTDTAIDYIEAIRST